MAYHKTWFGHIFGTAWDAVKSVFSGQSLQDIAIKITELVKNALNTKAADFILNLIPGHLDDDIANILKQNLPIILADELLVKASGLPATQEQGAALATKLIDSFGGLTDKQKERFFTSFAAEIFIFLQNHKGQKITWGEAASEVQTAYKLWLASQVEPLPTDTNG